MKVDVAVDLINGIQYLPGWKITAKDDTNRFEGSVTVRIDYPAIETDRSNAKVGYEKKITTYAEFRMIVQECPDQESVLFKVLQKIMEIHEHEARETFRIGPGLDAPFHPHYIAGMRAWAHRAYQLPAHEVSLLRDQIFGVN